MEVHESQGSAEKYFKRKFQDPKWLAFQNKFDAYSNKAYISKDFYEEHQSCSKKFRCNKKNPTKNQTYCQEKKRPDKSGCNAQKPSDNIYETAIPNTLTYACDGLGSRVYNCKFTSDGEKLLVTTQCGTSYFQINNYNQLEHSSVVLCDNVRWAITDSQLSSNNKFMIHVTISQYAHMFDVEKGEYVREFNLDKQEDGKSMQTCIEKMKVYGMDISGDDKDLIVGCNKLKDGGLVKIFDLEREITKCNYICHKEDVNSVCYLNKENPSIFLSASDDGTCKLWDSRACHHNGPAGVFYGHVSGLTCVTSKEDNRYFITNSKDQSLKLWDIRRYTAPRKTYNFFKYDYRSEVLTPMHIAEIKERQKAYDNSIMTFWGHQVHLTLIRCRFSPLHGTGQRYVYSGSFDGRVYIYDTITGENIVTLELPKEEDSSIFQCPVVRDCAWHPHSQTLVNTSFRGEVCRWEYMDLRDGEKLDEERMEVEESRGEENHGMSVQVCYGNKLPCQQGNKRASY